MYILRWWHVLGIKLAARKVRRSRFADLARRAEVDPQDARVAAELEVFVDLAPLETRAIDGLVGIGGQEEAVGRMAEADQRRSMLGSRSCASSTTIAS